MSVPERFHVGTVYGYIVWLTATEYIESVLFPRSRTVFSGSFLGQLYYLSRGPGVQFVSIARQGVILDV